jgi:hypothetical protein
MKWKWVVVIALFVVGILGAIVAIDWLTQPIHSVPSFLGGEAHHHGHFRRRGEALIVGSVIVLAVAVYLTIRFRREDTDTAGARSGDESAAVSDATGPQQPPAPTASVESATAEPATSTEAPVDNT